MYSEKKVLWSAEELLLHTGGCGFVNSGVYGVSIDSRTIERGDLFIALRGVNFDGHDFIGQAFDAGASAGIVDEEFLRNKRRDISSQNLISVKDTFGALLSLAKSARARSKAKILAITGSVGKTSVKEGVAMLLSRKFATHKSKGNLNNEIGAPLSISRMPANTKFGIFELGMSKAREIRGLVEIARPDSAIITDVTASHMREFSSMEDLADAKLEVFESDATKCMILNADSALFDYMFAAARKIGTSAHRESFNIVTFGKDSKSIVRLIDAERYERCQEVIVRAEICGKPVSYRLQDIGYHWVYVSLQVLSCILSLGEDPAEFCDILRDFSPIGGRGNIIELESGLRIMDETYNASIASMKAALSRVKDYSTSGKKIIVLGDMLELGDLSDRLHDELCEFIAGEISHRVNRIYFCGHHMEKAGKNNSIRCESVFGKPAVDIAREIKDMCARGDIVMIKGSRGMSLENVIIFLKSFQKNRKLA
ncbi:UDP-N-acetylmuramoyl-tripeptide--D-alanyl-D-alanine ligase [Candidatus Hydrogenosomobacter endosymbioticus]|uniref:UDP-N-acetylmuramoyl-tripeptide--D-alanyl-D-alanine ligase n=1 Tax=Candidatus Hydrogenosomobacter endosymbioticus TaxID=2558174 RepID=A0ABN6L366_9PROT|nr:UDP-N-acetylmuramoyl-tripeptide--D-alanyl-D-alanine ligase [Candidatus Hydrogenosomobacter endosymbioticus]BDB96311.1 UDP-N-acetylmuramoyl-tripeptide--D-alanyl-D-alanine ligase [Candidatus Hydrogenosomobacter endosymbioticus]